MAKRIADAQGAKTSGARTDAGKREREGQPERQPTLKGTFASVMILGAFLIAVWVSIFVLFVHRQ